MFFVASEGVFFVSKNSVDSAFNRGMILSPLRDMEPDIEPRLEGTEESPKRTEESSPPPTPEEEAEDDPEELPTFPEEEPPPELLPEVVPAPAVCDRAKGRLSSSSPIMPWDGPLCPPVTSKAWEDLEGRRGPVERRILLSCEDRVEPD